MAGSFSTIPGLMRYSMNTFHNFFAFVYCAKEGWESISAEQFGQEVCRLTLGLRAKGIQQGAAVGVLAKSSPWWLMADLAIMLAGGVSVPLFPHISKENFQHQVLDSNMQALFVLGQDEWNSFAASEITLPLIVTRNVAKKQDITDWNELQVLGDTLSKKEPALYALLQDRITENDLATIIYTSGTTGVPKGVELTHRNIISQVYGARKRFPLDSKSDKALSVLPLAHIFERTMMYYYMSTGVNIYFADDIYRAAELFSEVRPTIVAVVPRILERVFSKLQAKIHSSSFIKRMLGQWAFGLIKAKKKSWLKWLADCLVYSKIRAAFGGNMRSLISGGGALDPELCRFFLEVGVPVYQGYGLTETSPVLACNYLNHNKSGTVGLAYPDVDLVIAENQEILAKGPNVMRGYHGSIKNTVVHIDENGYLHTGDKGHIDEEGYLTIVGRMRDIYKTSNGKYVSPVPIEQHLCKFHLIETALVIAEGKKYVTALLFANLDVLKKLKKEKGMQAINDLEFLEGSFVKEEMKKNLDRVNAHVNKWEKVQNYRFVVKPLSIEGGDLTPTLKLRRERVISKYKNLIDEMYGEQT